MKFARKSRSIPRPAAIEGLEGRMLLSMSWEGTWSITGVNFRAQTASTAGSLSYSLGSMTANITKLSEGQYQLYIPVAPGGDSFTGTLIEDSATNTLNLDRTGQTGAERQYLKIVRLSDNAVAVSESSIEFRTDGVRLQSGEAFGGMGLRKGASVKTFSYVGSWPVGDSSLEAGIGSSGSGYVESDSSSQRLTITQSSSTSYQISTPDGTLPFRTLSGGQVLYSSARSASSSEYRRQMIMAMRGPDGRLMYVRAKADFNQSTTLRDRNGDLLPKGQLMDLDFGAGYSGAKNFAPVLSTTTAMKLNPIAEDTKTSGTSIADLIASSGIDSIKDPNTAPIEGIALIGVKTACGRWEYTTDGGTNWKAVSVSSTSALLLAADTAGLNRLRLIPAANFNGTVTSAITFRAWDRTSGTNGRITAISATGGSTPFSTATMGASIRVTPVNDAPAITGTSASTAIRFTEGAAPVVLLPNVVVSDVDSTNMSSATVKIGTGFVAGEDKLLFSSTTLTANIDSANGILTLTGSASKAAYQAALRTIRYQNTSRNPQVAARTVSVTVTDSSSRPSATRSQLLSVAAVNNAPTLRYTSSTVKRITLTGAARNTAFSIDFATLQSAITGIASYSDADNAYDTLGFRATKVSGTLSKGGTVPTTGVVTLMTGQTIAWKPATNATGTIKAFTVQVWDGKLASVNLIDVYITVA